MTEYLLPKEIAKECSISVKTVYNYLSKYSERIRIKKEFWKRIVNFEDFTKVFQKQLQFYKTDSQVSNENKEQERDWKENEELSKIQNEYNIVLSENQDLKKRTDVLERQLVKVGEDYMAEKNEKKAIQEKYYSLQNDLNTEIKHHNKEKLQLTAKYYRILILCVICLVILIIFTLPSTLEQIFPNL